MNIDSCSPALRHDRRKKTTITMALQFPLVEYHWLGSVGIASSSGEIVLRQSTLCISRRVLKNEKIQTSTDAHAFLKLLPMLTTRVKRLQT